MWAVSEHHLIAFAVSVALLILLNCQQQYNWCFSIIIDISVKYSQQHKALFPVIFVNTCRRHLNIRGKSANLPAITEKDWLDLQFGIDVGVDYYALSFVRSADVIYELKAYLAKQGKHAHSSLSPECQTAARVLFVLVACSQCAALRMMTHVQGCGYPPICWSASHQQSPLRYSCYAKCHSCRASI